jgi:hypothetical protein
MNKVGTFMMTPHLLQADAFRLDRTETRADNGAPLGRWSDGAIFAMLDCAGLLLPQTLEL